MKSFPYILAYLFSFFLFLAGGLNAIERPHIESKPISFSEHRHKMTRAYITEHYGDQRESIEMVPRMIVLHWTALNSLQSSFRAFNREELPGHREGLTDGGRLNVSAHYLVDTDGTIYQLMPDHWIARHVIGLNHVAIGIENVGGKDHDQNLTKAQVASNVKLIRYLSEKYPTITELIGHYEYRDYETSKSPLWGELVDGYRTVKSDPGPNFMKDVRRQLRDLHLNPNSPQGSSR